jgi:hypothetical protein
MLDQPCATPVVIRNDVVSAAKRVELAAKRFDERWLQERLFSHPTLIPFEELEPAFKGSVAVAMEVGVRSGLIDLLYVNADGLLTIAETKLWRNPEARRAVVSQLIDYAAELAKLDYGSLCDAIRAASDGDGDPLLDSLSRAGKEVDPTRFHDAVSRNLRLGRFLLLAIGDGIHEGVASMSDFLQGQPHLGFSLRLVEMAVFEFDGELSGTLLIQPRVVARTQEVTRAVIRFEGQGRMEVTTPPPPPAGAASAGRASITEAEYFRRLADEGEATVAQVEFVRRVLRDAPGHSLFVDWKQNGPLLKYSDESRETFFTLGGFDWWGQFSHTGRFARRCLEEELPTTVWQAYFDRIRALVPGSTVKPFRLATGATGAEIVYSDDADVLAALVAHEQEWWAALDAAVAAVRQTAA